MLTLSLVLFWVLAGTVVDKIDMVLAFTELAA